MDFLYADLNEMVDPCAYSVELIDGTIDLKVDNENRTISAKLNNTSGKLYIKDACQTKDVNEAKYFDGYKDINIELPRYILKEVKNEYGEDVRKAYLLFGWDYEQSNYVPIVDSDIIYLDELLDEINIENGGNQPSQKIGVGNSSITSVKYKYNGEQINAYNVDLPVNKFNDVNTSELIIGINSGNVIDGGTYASVQSIAFGGLAFGISNINLLIILFDGNVYRYNILSNKPLVIKSTVGDRTYVEQNGVIYIGDIGRGVGLNVSYDSQTNDVKLVALGLPNLTTKVVKGFNDTPTASGKQSISIGGGTHANTDWSQAFGLGTTTSSSGLMVVGAFNKEEDDALFVVGNGNYNVLTGEINRLNAFVVKKDGSIDFDVDATNLPSKDYIALMYVSKDDMRTIDYGVLS